MDCTTPRPSAAFWLLRALVMQTLCRPQHSRSSRHRCTKAKDGRKYSPWRERSRIWRKIIHSSGSKLANRLPLVCDTLREHPEEKMSNRIFRGGCWQQSTRDTCKGIEGEALVGTPWGEQELTTQRAQCRPSRRGVSGGRAAQATYLPLPECPNHPGMPLR